MALGDYGFLLIGGRPSFDQVREYSVETGQWREEGRWPRLGTERWGHGCARVGDKIVVAGGRSSTNIIQYSTEVLSISERTTKTVGRLNTARYGHVMVALGGEGGSQELYAIGGYGGLTAAWLSIVERWEEDKMSWVTEVTGLKERRSRMGALVVPTDSVCLT